MFAWLLIVFFIAVWIALYVIVIRPKLREFRYTSGIYAELDAFEAGFWSKVVLLLRGLKVAILAVITSAAPLVGVLYEKISGLDWTQFLASDRAKIVLAVIAALGVIGPVIMAWLHQHAIAAAAAVEPQE